MRTDAAVKDSAVPSHSPHKKIALAQPVFNGHEKQYVNQCMDTGWISSAGEFILKFETEFAKFCGTRNAIACSNGTVAIHLALMARRIGPGDEVIVPSLTYIATANAVTYCGATPVFVDCDPKTWNMDPKSVAEKITAKTKAIMPVHLYGLTVDMDPIVALAKKHKLFIIEDAAQSHGATYKGKRVGSIGEMGTFSFFGNKVITSGEGGMVVTDDDLLAQRMKLLRNHAMSPDRRYWFEEVGYNYRMTNVQAAIGLAQLEKIDWHLGRRREVATWYNEKLGALREVITLPHTPVGSDHIYWLFTVLVNEKARLNRDQLMAALATDGIETRPMFYPVSTLPPYEKKAGSFPVSEAVSLRGISLPSHAALSAEDISYIADRIKYHLTGK